MIISKTPIRLTLFGGGTDYPVWYKSKGGIVISATINKYNYIVILYKSSCIIKFHRMTIK